MLQYHSVTEAVLNQYGLFNENCSTSSPRGMKIRELINHSFMLLNPRDRIFFNHERKLNYQFMAAEFLWIISGSNDLAMISFYNSKMKDYSDNGITLYGAYGSRIMSHQFRALINKFKIDKDTRQGVISIYNSSDAMMTSTKDLPCTVMFQFIIRDNKLNMMTWMRSNDAYLGLPYDLFTFTCIQEYLLLQLKEFYPDLELGVYYHNTGSLHVYEQHFKQVEQMADDYFNKENDTMMEKGLSDYVKKVSQGMPHMTNELRAALNWEKNFRKSKLDQIQELKDDNGFWSILISMLKMKDKYVRDSIINRLISEVPYFNYYATEFTG